MPGDQPIDAHLKSLLDQTLIDSLPQGVKDSVDRLLAAGEPKAKVLAVAAAAVEKAGGGPADAGGGRGVPGN
jgi:hypothetical protein